MSEMIERVAKALYGIENGPDGWYGPLLQERGRVAKQDQ